MRRLLLLLCWVTLATLACGQNNKNYADSGLDSFKPKTCTAPFIYTTTDTGIVYTCFNGRLVNVGASNALPTASTAGQVPVSSAAGTSYAAQSKPTLDVRDVTGANAGLKIQAAHDSASCPSTGCIIDARGLGATDTIAGLAITKPVSFIFGQTAFSVTASLVFTNITGPKFEGAGPGITTFTWAGNNSTPMFKLVSVRDTAFGAFSLNASTAFPLTSFFTSERGVVGNPTNNSFTDIVGDGTNGGVTDGFRWLVGAGGDMGNDVFKFSDVVFNNYANAGWNNNGSTQSQANTFFSCQANSNGYGNYGFQGTGSFAMFNMAFGSNKISDIFINQISNGVLVSGGISIGSNRLYTEVSASGAAFNVTFENFNFASTGLNGDGKVVIFLQRGPYLLLNNAVSGNAAIPAQFNFAPSSTAGVSATAIGNNVLTNLANPFTAPATTPWELLNNTINTGPPTTLADQFANTILFGQDNTYDLGAFAANRPRTGYFGTSVVAPKVQITLATPASSADACTAGQMWADTGFVYVCSATNTIKRAALSTF